MLRLKTEPPHGDGHRLSRIGGAALVRPPVLVEFRSPASTNIFPFAARPPMNLVGLLGFEDGSALVLFIVAYRPLTQNSVSIDPGTHLSYGSSFLGGTCGTAS
jgi:hypothetical protein